MYLVKNITIHRLIPAFLLLIAVFNISALAHLRRSSKTTANKQSNTQSTDIGVNKSTMNAEEEWQYIRSFLKDFYRANNASIPNDTTSIFSALIYNEAEFAYANRKEKGGWAGNMIRGNFFAAVKKIQGERNVWEKASNFTASVELFLNGWPLTKEWINEEALKMVSAAYEDPDLLDQIEIMLVTQEYKKIYFRKYIEGIAKGGSHLFGNVYPNLYQYTLNELRELVKRYPKNDGKRRTELYLALILKMREIRREHIADLENALLPAVKIVFNDVPVARAEAKTVIPLVATGLRVTAFRSALMTLKTEKLVNPLEVDGLLYLLTPGTDGDAAFIYESITKSLIVNVMSGVAGNDDWLETFTKDRK